MVASDRSQTLTVAQQSFRLLTHVQSIEGTDEETVEWWELRDPNDRVVVHESYPVAIGNGTFDETHAINASSFTTDQGSGVLIHGFEQPSDPGDGGWLQVFGFKYGRDKYGADQSLFGPFGPPIMINDGKFLDVGTDPRRANPPPAAAAGPSVTVMHDILRFRLWTGNFNIVYPVLINWITGKLQAAWSCPELTSKGRVERCSYPITVEAQRGDQPTFVRLFPDPDEGNQPKHIIVQPQSKIDYLEARMPVAWNDDGKTISFNLEGDAWIKIRIDGVEGWIHTQEDFDAVGLRQSD